MTTPRIARAGRSRFFIGIVALILLVGFVAIFHSSQLQLDQSRQLALHCERQQEALNARMQAIVEHKFRLEKSLETERRDYMETKNSLEKKVKEQKDQHAKASLESNVRYESLQQHYKLLQSEHNDLVEECEKAKTVHLGQINGLDRKTNLLQAQLTLAGQKKEKDVLHWKIKYETVEHEKQRLEALLKASQAAGQLSPHSCGERVLKLEKAVADCKIHCNYNPLNNEQQSDHTPSIRTEVVKSAIEKSFNEQVPVSEGLYKIAVKVVNNTNKMHDLNTIIPGDGNSLKMEGGLRGGIINSVENFQIAQKPLLNGDDRNGGGKADNLQQPPPLRAPSKSSTLSSNSKTPEGGSNRGALPIASVASSTSERTKKSSTATNDKNKEYYKSLGVAPVPENFEDLVKKDEEHNQSGNRNPNVNNNRYANVDEFSGKNEAEQDNAAHEEKDNDFNLGEEKNDPKDHLQEVLDNMNNAAEEDTNNFFDSKLVGRQGKKEIDEDDVEGIGGNKHDKADDLLEGKKLINEVVGDQGKVAFPEGLHLEEAAEEDDDDYSNPVARQQEGPAVRN